jgi:hypothetical protein
MTSSAVEEQLAGMTSGELPALPQEDGNFGSASRRENGQTCDTPGKRRWPFDVIMYARQKSRVALMSISKRWLSHPYLCAAYVALACSHVAASSLGSHTLLAHEDGNGPSTAITAPITTAANGSTLLVFSAGYTDNNQPPTDSHANAWSQLGAPVVYRGYNGAFNVTAYLVLQAQGGASHTVSIVKNNVPSGEITVPFIELRDAGVLQSVAVNYPPASGALTSGTVTTTAAATLIAVWWGDATGLHHSAVPDNGFSIIENFVDLPPNSAVQCVVAAKQVTGAGTYSVTWATSPQQGAPLWLLAFQSGEAVFANGFETGG